MFKLEDGREHFYQWDLDRRIIVEDETIKQVHFSNAIISESLVVNTYAVDGVLYADVPNILLQTDWDIKVYAHDGCHTCNKACYEVEAREKPADYVYTETEVLRFENLEARMNEVEEAMESFDSEVMEKRFEDIEAEVKEIELKAPVRGVDYWTPADKEEIINETIAALPRYEGEVEVL